MTHKGPHDPVPMYAVRFSTYDVPFFAVEFACLVDDCEEEWIEVRRAEELA